MLEFDSLLLVSFGGPEGPEDVMPFLRNVTRGRGIPDERLLSVAEHYQHFGGKSPINDQNRALIEALQEELRRSDIDLPIYFGNRNWQPYLAETVEQMRADGRKRSLALITSAYSSYSGCRQYREDLEKARESVPGAPELVPIRRFFNHPGFLEASAERVGAALAQLEAKHGSAVRAAARVVYTAHSIPTSMAQQCDYEAQLRANAGVISELNGHAHWELAWQSRSGPPQVPWLEPDIGDRLKELRAEGVEAVVIAPVGFISDHMEVMYDLDVEARELCDELGMKMARAGTVGTHPRFVQGLRQLIQERIAQAPVLSLGPLPARPNTCGLNCCPKPVRPRPATRAVPE